MPNRYARDELIKIALQQAQLPQLEHHDMPNGVVMPDAYCIQFLQDILDFWYHMVPFSATVKMVYLNCTAHQNYIVLPSDFILDVRNGYTVQTIQNNTQSYKRTFRLPLQKFINRRLYYQNKTDALYPCFYCIQGDDNTSTQYQTMQIEPVPVVATSGQLWYYALPPVLTAVQKPKFPNDYVCIEYVRIRAREWAGILPIGSAQQFCDKVVGGMKSAGLMNEPEDDEIPFDQLSFKHAGIGSLYNSTYAWMGSV